MAAAEDFDPLRIRPYVNLEASGAEADPHVPMPPADLPTVVSEGLDPATAAMPMPMPAVSHDGMDAGARAGAGIGYAAESGGGPQAYSEGDASETMPLLLDRAAFGAPPEADPEHEPPGRRRGLMVALVAGLAVAGTAAFAVGVLGGDDQDGLAGPDAASSSTALLVSEAPTPTPSESESESDRESASPSTSESASRSASPSASPSRTASAAAPRRSTSAPAPSTSSSRAEPPTGPEDGGPTLSRGDSGPEVLELQRRLKEIWAYKGPENGEYSGKVEEGVASFQSYMHIEEDPWGVYGPATREALEAVTSG
ncbi:peptidoglycan-binding domain-containing protein [Streptomyces sp. NPDC048629]|uniref:peptidoglycan-binding domain-containing protein n=1 Tax=Streptomyces sp. NPDC048629 TaxID=3154824 RepID=UPI00343D54C8